MVRGTTIVFAPRTHIDAVAAAQIAQRDGTCDLPCAGTQVAAGDPLCSLVAGGRDVHEVTTNWPAAATRCGLLETRA
jgi:predicted ATP-grasp superfamily ATP-dependent carboligase